MSRAVACRPRRRQGGRRARQAGPAARRGVLALIAVLLAGCAGKGGDPVAERIRSGLESYLASRVAHESETRRVELAGAVEVVPDAGRPGSYVVTLPRLTWRLRYRGAIQIAPIVAQVRPAGGDLYEARWTLPPITVKAVDEEGRAWTSMIRYAGQSGSGLLDAGLGGFRAFEGSLSGVTFTAGRGAFPLEIAELRWSGTRTGDAEGPIGLEERFRLSGLRLLRPGTGSSLLELGGAEAAVRLHGWRPDLERRWGEAMLRLAETAGEEGGDVPSPARRRAARDALLAVLDEGLLEGGAFDLALRGLVVQPPGEAGGRVDLVRLGLRAGAVEEPGGMVLEAGLEGLAGEGEPPGDARLVTAVQRFPFREVVADMLELALAGEAGGGDEAGEGLGARIVQRARAARTAVEVRRLDLEMGGARIAGRGSLQAKAGEAQGAVLDASLSIEGIEALAAALGEGRAGRQLAGLLRAAGRPGADGRLDYRLALDASGRLRLNGHDVSPLIDLLRPGEDGPARIAMP